MSSAGRSTNCGLFAGEPSERKPRRWRRLLLAFLAAAPPLCRSFTELTVVVSWTGWSRGPCWRSEPCASECPFWWWCPATSCREKEGKTKLRDESAEVSQAQQRRSVLLWLRRRAGSQQEIRRGRQTQPRWPPSAKFLSIKKQEPTAVSFYILQPETVCIFALRHRDGVLADILWEPTTHWGSTGGGQATCWANTKNISLKSTTCTFYFDIGKDVQQRV